MPLFRVKGRLHYYAHVPKCAGSAVENYLRERFGSLAFVNTRFYDQAEAERWTKSSPQHAAFADIQALIPGDWIASSFAVVRHPLKRLVSSFLFQAEKEGTVPEGWGIDEWVEAFLNSSRDSPFQYDNHLRPQSQLVPGGATVFRLEEGMHQLVAHLDLLADDRGGPREIAHVNEAKSRKDTGRNTVPSPATLEKLVAYYAIDFRRFGYDPEGVTLTAPRAVEAAGGNGLFARVASRLGRRA
ncbi:MAG: sulfotransferase family 2 domain-containing protein [Paracoccaceae bacterium]